MESVVLQQRMLTVASDEQSASTAGTSHASSRQPTGACLLLWLLEMQLVQDWRAFRARLVAMESGQTARAASMQVRPGFCPGLSQLRMRRLDMARQACSVQQGCVCALLHRPR